MSTARREEILKAEEAIRALANELAAAQTARGIHEESALAIRAALDDVHSACSSLEGVQADLRQNVQHLRKEILAASEDIGAATDFAHERLKETVEKFRSVSQEIEFSSQQQVEELRQFRSSIIDEIQVIDRNVERLTDLFRANAHQQEEQADALRLSLTSTEDHIRVLESTVVRQGRLLMVGVIVLFITSVIVLLSIVLR